MSGLVPFGYSLAQDGRTLEANAEEASVIETIRTLREQGHSMPAIAEELNRGGVRTRAGSPWRFEYVRRVLKRITRTAA